MSKYLARLGELSGKPGSGVVSFDLDDLPTLGEEWRATAEASVEIGKRFLAGDIPTHFVFDVPGFGPADVFAREPPVGGERAPGLPVMALNGSRSGLEDAHPPLSSQGGRIVADVTALMLAAQAGLLAALERLPDGGLAVPPSLPQALNELEHALRDRQPAIVSAETTVLKAVRDGRAKRRRPSSTDASQLLSAQGESALPAQWTADGHGWVVGELRPVSPGTTGVEATPTGHLPESRQANLRAVVDGLLAAGAIDVRERGDALTALGSAGQETAIGEPVEGESLLLCGSTASELAYAGLFALVLARFDVHVEEEVVASMEASLALAATRDRLAQQIASLRAWVVEGLRCGRIASAPCNLLVNETKIAGEEWTRTAMRAHLSEMFRLVKVPNTVVWFGDRYLTRYQDTDGTPIIGVTEALERLREADLLSSDAHFDALRRLRAARVMFIAVRAEEVLAHLSLAPVTAGKVVETPALATLRRYVATALMLEDHLQLWSASDGSSAGETAFLLAMRRLAQDAVCRIWCEAGIEDELRIARSNWVWGALRVDRFRRLPFGEDRPRADRLVLSLQLAGMITGGLSLLVQLGPRENLARLRAYNKWLNTRVLSPRLAEDVTLAGQLAALVSQHVRSFMTGNERGEKPLPRGTADRLRLHVRVFADETPDPIKDALISDREFTRVFGLKTRVTLAVEGHLFQPDAFWRAVESTLAGKEKRVRTLDGADEVQMQRGGTAERPTIVLSGSMTATLGDRSLLLASKQMSLRRATAGHLVDELGLPVAERAAAVKQLTSGSPSDRMHTLSELREGSVNFHYGRLRHLLQTAKAVPWLDLLRPPVIALLRHVGIRSDLGHSVARKAAVSEVSLIEDFGVTEAVRRLSCLPVPLPENLLGRTSSLPAAKRQALLDFLSEPTATPVRRLHAVRLGRAWRETGTDGGAKAFDAALDGVGRHWPATGPLFVAVIKKVARVPDVADSPWWAMPPEARLAAAWMHADHLVGTLLEAGHDPLKATEAFSGAPYATPIGATVSHEREFDGSAADPGSLTHEALLFHGLGYALGTEVPATAAAHLDAIRQMLSRDIEGKCLPFVLLYSDRASADNALGTWMTARPAWLFGSGLDLSDESTKSEIAGLVDKLSPGVVTDATLWVLLNALAQPALAPDVLARVSDVLRGANFESIVAAEPISGMAALQAGAHLARAVGDEVTREALVVQIEAVARRLSVSVKGSIAPSPAMDGQTAMTELLEAAGALARGRDAEEGWSRFGRLALRIAIAWPDCAGHVRDVVERAAGCVTTEGLWTACLELRSRA